ncbi:hypothetical protein DRO66_11075, partial [Candidatus Bathyarchaeota archaeon]
WDRRKFNPNTKEGQALIKKEALSFMRELRNPKRFEEFNSKLASKMNEAAAAEAFSQGGGAALEEQARSTVSELIRRNK